jgi:hypothetical protein
MILGIKITNPTAIDAKARVKVAAAEISLILRAFKLYSKAMVSTMFSIAVLINSVAMITATTIIIIAHSYVAIFKTNANIKTTNDAIICTTNEGSSFRDE